MKKQLFILLFLTVLSSISAQSWSTKKIKGNGTLVSQERKIPSFHSLNVSGNFEVNFSTELSTTLQIKGDENLLKDVITEVNEGILKIKTKNKVYLRPSNDKIKIILPHGDLKQISLSGSGKISSRLPFEYPQFESNVSGSGHINLFLNIDKAIFNVSGSGKIEVQGETETLKAKLSGSGSLKAKNFKAENGDLNLSGSGRMEVRCTEKLNAKVSGSGRIRYFGEPKTKLNSKVSGSGSIRLAIIE